METKVEKTNVMKTKARRLREFMEANRMNQRDISKRLEVCPQFLGRALKTEQIPPSIELALAKKYHYFLDEDAQTKYDDKISELLEFSTKLKEYIKSEKVLDAVAKCNGYEKAKEFEEVLEKYSK